MRNGCTLVAMISAMLTIINEIIGQRTDLIHLVIGMTLAIATLIVIWRIETRKNNSGGWQ